MRNFLFERQSTFFCVCLFVVFAEGGFKEKVLLTS
jgi:hypothetical protein